MSRLDDQFGKQLDLKGEELMDAIANARSKKDPDVLRVACVEAGHEAILAWQAQNRRASTKISLLESDARVEKARRGA